MIIKCTIASWNKRSNRVCKHSVWKYFSPRIYSFTVSYETKISPCSHFTCTYKIKDTMLKRHQQSLHISKFFLPCTLIRWPLCAVTSVTKYMPTKNNHVIKQLFSLLQDAAHFKLKTKQNLEAYLLYFSVGDGNHILTDSLQFSKLIEIKLMTKIKLKFHFTLLRSASSSVSTATSQLVA